MLLTLEYLLAADQEYPGDNFNYLNLTLFIDQWSLNTSYLYWILFCFVVKYDLYVGEHCVPGLTILFRGNCSASASAPTGVLFFSAKSRPWACSISIALFPQIWFLLFYPNCNDWSMWLPTFHNFLHFARKPGGFALLFILLVHAQQFDDQSGTVYILIYLILMLNTRSAFHN